MQTGNHQAGFSLIELIVSLSLFVTSILLVTAMYSLVQKTYRAGSDKAEVAQNARVALDRLSREVRQAVDFVGVLATTTSSASDNLEFQDGHDQSSINYIKYSLSGTNLVRENKYYYFSSDPTIKVIWNHLDGLGNAPLGTTTNSNVVGEYFQTLAFFSSSSAININATIKKNSAQYTIDTKLYYRN